MRSADIVHLGRRIYMDVGSLEGTRKDNEQRNMVAKNQEAYEILLEKGFSREYCQFVTHEGGDHGHSFFLKRFPTVLQWLFPHKDDQLL
jgi:predicted alpha/beta superfamily hydrolase